MFGNLTLFGGGVMQICILDILFDAVEAHACLPMKLFHINNWQHFMILGGCVQKLWPFSYSTLVGNQIFLVKTLKNWTYYKIESFDSFSLNFRHNTYNDDAKILKK